MTILKRMLIILTLLQGWATIHAQQGYRYGGKNNKINPSKRSILY